MRDSIDVAIRDVVMEHVRERPPRRLTPPRGPKVVAQVADVGGPVIWRVIWPFCALAATGYQAAYCPPWDPAFDDVAELSDAVLLARVYFERTDWAVARQFVEGLQTQGKAVIMELDDDLISPAALPQITLLGAQQGRTVAMMDASRQSHLAFLGLCDGVTVTTEPLAAIVRQYTDKPVVVIPNAIDWDWWQAQVAQMPAADGRLTIGWAGGRRLPHDTAALAEAWRRLAPRYPHVAFKVAGYHDPALCDAVPPGQLIRGDWAPLERYAQAYAGIDIGCCPLADVPFNRCKSPIKAYEFGALGAAVVASRIVYSQVLQDGRLGLLADTSAEWEYALELLIEQESLRRELARRWAKRVRERYSLSQNLYRWPEGWQRIVDDAHRRRPPGPPAPTRLVLW